MKKNILIGIISPLFLFFALNVIRYIIYTDAFSGLGWFDDILFYLLPALPGISLMFLLVRNSMKEYFKSLSVCFLISFAVTILYIFLGIDQIISMAITGYEDLGLGDGLLMVIIFHFYAVSCLAGTIVAGIVTFVKKRIAVRNAKKEVISIS